MDRNAIMVIPLVCLLSVGALAIPAQASESQWAVNLTLDGPLAPMSDGTTCFGIAGDANCDYNPGRDAPNPAPPPSGDYVDLYFYRPTWPGQSDWAQDWREPIAPGGSQTWEDIRAISTAAGIGSLCVQYRETDYEPPAYYSFILYDEGDSPDPTGGTPHDMRTQSCVTFPMLGGGAPRYFHITVTDTRQPTSVTMDQPEYASTYGQAVHVEATLMGGELPLPLGCLPGARFEWDLDGDGEYDDLSADGVDNDCDGTYEADVLLDACAGTYSVRAVFDGDDSYQPSASPPAAHENHKGWIEILGGETLPMEEISFTYSDPGTVMIIARDGAGNPLLHPEQLPEVLMQIYSYSEGYGLVKRLDKASPKLAESMGQTYAEIELEVQEGGEVDLVPGGYYAVFIWPGDCHYHAAIADAALIVEPETIVAGNIPEFPHFSAESQYCEQVTIGAQLRDDDGEPLYHLGDSPVITGLRVHNPLTLAWDLVESKATSPGGSVTFTYAPEELWEADAARAAADTSLQYELSYYGSPYYEPAQDAGSWTVNAFDKSSPMLYSGWNMVGVAGYPVDPDPASVFAGIDTDGALYRYDPVAMGYVPYLVVDSGPFGEVQPGDGYWLYLDSEASFTYPAYCMSRIEIDMPTAGWYLIGDPLGESVPIEHVSFSHGGQTLPFPEAVAAGWVSNPLYWWDPVFGGYVTMGIDPWDLAYLPAFSGAWIQVNAMDMYMKIGDI
ncbi:hypothetical protein AMK68_01085 [candidate division KD3-62 bacterium DG_56]|uniref:Uncharacterized protein n=1 Tax=candidate division KD3-62 bacterium DG_56 TaxID=1704032 RepID=A0A0S7XQD1_9BACT|nr:MAG: hypothetical protein AMK68_01085 [candidate division KD3-62 bacterium DG_56]